MVTLCMQGLHGAMVTNSFLYNGTVFPNKSPHFKAGRHEVESTNLLSPMLKFIVTNGLT